jgi:hypothetical protein
MFLEVDRHDLHRTRLIDDPPAPADSPQARLRVDRFGLTSNNVTYAAFGDALQYWNFFPAADEWGRVPVWGFADVVESDTADLPVDSRVYGYFPMGDELVVQVGRADERGFGDASPHRQAMAGAYNRYVLTTHDPIYKPETEAQHMVLWPLFFTSFVIDDFFADNDMFGAANVVVSSASSKTAIGAAFLLNARGNLNVIGATSASNADFVASLGCYGSVVTYDAMDALPDGHAVYVDIAGNLDVRGAVHGHYGDALQYSMVVGSTHWDHQAEAAPVAAGPEPQFFFAPTQIAKRTKEWGQATLDERVSAAWASYAGWTDGWLTFEHCDGPDAVEAVFARLVDGDVDPRVGYVCSMYAAR